MPHGIAGLSRGLIFCMIPVLLAVFFCLPRLLASSASSAFFDRLIGNDRLGAPSVKDYIFLCGRQKKLPASDDLQAYFDESSFSPTAALHALLKTFPNNMELLELCLENGADIPDAIHLECSDSEGPDEQISFMQKSFEVLPKINGKIHCPSESGRVSFYGQMLIYPPRGNYSGTQRMFELIKKYTNAVMVSEDLDELGENVLNPSASM